MKNKRIFIKGFNKDLKCRDYQFEIGKEYKIDNGDKKLELCTDTVFHFCDSLAKVHSYYSCEVEENNRFCIIEPLGELVEDGDKIGSDHIKIVRELIGEELNVAKGLTGGNAGLFNSGNNNTGRYNTGHGNSGIRNTGNWNSGIRNTGNYNSGHGNSGIRNTGHWNSGIRNTGNYNSGDFNTGRCNSGNNNTGAFNKTHNSNGVFCNIEPNINIFNIQTDMTLTEFYNSKYWDAICSSDFELTEWCDDKLVTYSYEDACKKWWANMSVENKDIIKSMPNFNVEVFCDITGIKRIRV